MTAQTLLLPRIQTLALRMSGDQTAARYNNLPTSTTSETIDQPGRAMAYQQQTAFTTIIITQ